MISMPEPKVDPEVEAQKQAADVSRVSAIKQSLGSDTSNMLKIFGGGGGLGSLLAPGVLAPPQGGGAFSSATAPGLGGMYQAGIGSKGPTASNSISTGSMGGGLF